VPRAYPEYLQRPSNSDFYLLYVDPIRPELDVIDMDWYDDSYDKGYQGVIGAVEVSCGFSNSGLNSIDEVS